MRARARSAVSAEARTRLAHSETPPTGVAAVAAAVYRAVEGPAGVREAAIAAGAAERDRRGSGVAIAAPVAASTSAAALRCESMGCAMAAAVSSLLVGSNPPTARCWPLSGSAATARSPLPRRYRPWLRARGGLLSGAAEGPVVSRWCGAACGSATARPAGVGCGASGAAALACGQDGWL